jgi:hypothetical protein
LGDGVERDGGLLGRFPGAALLLGGGGDQSGLEIALAGRLAGYVRQPLGDQLEILGERGVVRLREPEVRA